MKYTFIAIILICTLNVVFAQQDQQILEIDSTIEVLTKGLDKLSKTEKFKNDTLGFTYAYSDKEELKAIILQYNDLPTDTRKDVSWFFSNDELIYAEQKWTTIATSKISDHQKFYSHKMKLVAWVKGEEFVDKDSQEFQEAEKKLMEYTKNKIKSLEKQRSTPR